MTPILGMVSRLLSFLENSCNTIAPGFSRNNVKVPMISYTEVVLMSGSVDSVKCYSCNKNCPALQICKISPSNYTLSKGSVHGERVLHRKYLRYLNTTSMNVVTILCAIRPTKFHLSSTIIDKWSSTIQKEIFFTMGHGYGVHEFHEDSPPALKPRRRTHGKLSPCSLYVHITYLILY